MRDAAEPGQNRSRRDGIEKRKDRGRVPKTSPIISFFRHSTQSNTVLDVTFIKNLISLSALTLRVDTAIVWTGEYITLRRVGGDELKGKSYTLKFNVSRKKKNFKSKARPAINSVAKLFAVLRKRNVQVDLWCRRRRWNECKTLDN